MEKINRPLNLVGFYSQETVRQNKQPVFTPRMVAYTVIMVVLLGVLTSFMVTRSAIDVTILRSPGMLYQQQPGGYISNIYNADIINKSNRPQQIQLLTANPAVKLKYIQKPGVIPAEGTAKAVFFLMMPASGISKVKTNVKVNVVLNNKVIDTEEITFTGPVN